MTQDAALLSGVLLILLAIILALFFAFRPRYKDIHVSRRRPHSRLATRQ